MAEANTDSREWSDAEEAIMQATYRALLEHGYAGLSISRIADELGKTKASIYYHYDSKDDLLVAFLDYTADRFEQTVGTDAGTDPYEELEHVVERLLPLGPDEDRRQMEAVLTSLRCQAVADGVYREQFSAMDDRLARTIRDIVERGVDSGAFREVDPVRVTEHVVATVNGAAYGRATTDRESAAAVRDSLSSYFETELRPSD